MARCGVKEREVRSDPLHSVDWAFGASHFGFTLSLVKEFLCLFLYISHQVLFFSFPGIKTGEEDGRRRRTHFVCVLPSGGIHVPTLFPAQVIDLCNV